MVMFSEGSVSHSVHRGGLPSGGEPWTETPWTEAAVDRDRPAQRQSWTETPWTETPLDRDRPGQWPLAHRATRHRGPHPPQPRAVGTHPIGMHSCDGFCKKVTMPKCWLSVVMDSSSNLGGGEG